jgi:APA family basic amino acid/polyamine antiporter
MGWSGYVVGFLSQAGVHLPTSITTSLFDGGIFNLPAAIIVLVMSCVLIRGTEESSLINMILVVIKLSIILLFVFIALPFFKFSNWGNFMPFGLEGVAIGAGTVFVSYTGFDAIANAAEETHKPEKNIVIGLVGSVAIATIFYMLVAGMLTGIADFKLLNTPEPLAYALKLNGSNMGGAIIAVGAITGMTTVVLVQTYALTRVLMAMSRDGLVPKFFSKIHKKYSTPYINTMVCGLCLAICAGIFPIVVIGRLASIGTLIILCFVVINALVLRKNKPNLHRPFKCPFLPVISLLGFTFCLYLIYSLLKVIGLVFMGWVVLGVFIYFIYARKNASKVYVNNH